LPESNGWTGAAPLTPNIRSGITLASHGNNADGGAELVEK